MGRKRNRNKLTKPTRSERKRRQLERKRSADASSAAVGAMGPDTGSLSSPDPVSTESPATAPATAPGTAAPCIPQGAGLPTPTRIPDPRRAHPSSTEATAAASAPVATVDSTVDDSGGVCADAFPADTATAEEARRAAAQAAEDAQRAAAAEEADEALRAAAREAEDEARRVAVTKDAERVAAIKRARRVAESIARATAEEAEEARRAAAREAEDEARRVAVTKDAERVAAIKRGRRVAESIARATAGATSRVAKRAADIADRAEQKARDATADADVAAVWLDDAEEERRGFYPDSTGLTRGARADRLANRLRRKITCLRDAYVTAIEKRDRAKLRAEKARLDRDRSASAAIKAASADPVYDGKPLEEMTMDEAKRTPYDYYRLLGVPVDCDQVDIKKAYHRLALVHHPDKGGDETICRIINHAKDTLTERRQHYDRKGRE